MNHQRQVQLAENDDQSAPGASSHNALLGMFFVLLAQVSQAVQYVWEERMMTSMKLPPLLLVGLEGICGLCVMTCVVFPVLGQLPGKDYGGCLESFWDSWAMLYNDDGHLVVMVVAFVFAVTGLNISALLVTKLLSAVVRALMQNGARTLTIWVTDLILFYAVTNGTFGESWVYPYSEVEAIGFAFCVVGALFYGKFLSLEKFGFPFA
eukprot:gnl/MRDRNA2_/MRDRNA2_41343_c0_seq2.p1 gnl/MRDRNA2_/MRDRNA2_41343_c0~~gnl/MRDRNA2_/MRDRNA2_41343_c0_seq2.p1  ORF type:complete len:208 (-),score=28.36 gnl/MRDRNA2_/MRDRNA2_41343_c0_seq2:82-705(-)